MNPPRLLLLKPALCSTNSPSCSRHLSCPGHLSCPVPASKDGEVENETPVPKAGDAAGDALLGGHTRMGEPVSDPSVINAEIFYQGKIPPILQLRAEAQTHDQ